MSNKIYFFLLIILVLNTLRYGSYLMEGQLHWYNLTLFIANFLGVIVVIIYKIRERIKVETAPNSNEK